MALFIGIVMSLIIVPIIIIIGKKEVEQQTLSLRRLGSDTTETIDIKDALSLLKKEASSPN